MDLLANFNSFINEKCQALLNEYSEFYCLLVETLDGIKRSPELKAKFERLFAQIGGDNLYDRLITGADFEIVFRNVLSSALLRLTQMITELLDHRQTEIHIKKLEVQKFIEKHLILTENLRVVPDLETSRDNEYESDHLPVFDSYDNHLYDTIN